MSSGISHQQDVLTHPGANLSVGTAANEPGIEARLNGVAPTYTDRVVPLGEALLIAEAELIRQMIECPEPEQRVAMLAKLLQGVLDRADPAAVAGALTVTELARTAETDRSIQRVEQLAVLAGVGVRRLQRLFREHAGVSPTWVLRRYRLLDAAELVRDG